MVSYQQLQPHRPCPICNHNLVTRLYSQWFSTLSSGSLLSGYDVVTCANCGFGYADHIPAQTEFDLYYRDMSKYEFQDSDGNETSYDAARYDEIANQIAPYIQSPIFEILDIGCATGGLLYRIKQKGFTKLTGIDPSPTCASLARQLYDIPVMTKTITEMIETQVKYDFIILVGVLEHIRDIKHHLERVKDLLTENGRIFVEVPDVLRFDNWPDAPYQQFSMEHINFFSPTSLLNLMSMAGFIDIHTEELVREQSRGTWMPVVSAVFEKAPASTWHKPEIQRCEYTQQALLRYIEYSKAVEGQIQSTITELADSQLPILVWGTGTHTLHLLENSALSKTNIVAFVDSNPRYQNKNIKGIPIVAPKDLRNYPQPILVSSRVFQEDIKKNITEVLRLQNRLILLYDNI